MRNGILNARGEIIVFSDADLSSPIEEMPKLLEALAAGADIAIGSRWLRAELQTQRQSLHRQLFGQNFQSAEPDGSRVATSKIHSADLKP